MRKRIISLLLACTILVAAAAQSAFSSAEIDRILDQINATFAKAKEISGRTSFRDWCTEYVKYQLIALGITSKEDKDIGGNGTQMYYLVNAGETTTGYKKGKYEGSNCIYDIVSAYKGENVYNILVSWFHGFRNTDSEPGPGHVVFIHAIIDGYIYYSESYPTGDGILEGQPRVHSIEKFYQIYNGYYGHAVGAVVFYKEAPPHTVHDYKLTTVEPTCTEDGARIYTCTVCGDEYSEPIPSEGHDYEIVVVEGDCITDGVSKLYCPICKDEVVIQFIPAPGHDFVNGYCTRCGLEEIVGDVNGDGNVNAKDVTSLMKMLISPDPILSTVTDVKADGRLNAKDVASLMKLIIGSVPEPQEDET